MRIKYEGKEFSGDLKSMEVRKNGVIFQFSDFVKEFPKYVVPLHILLAISIGRLSKSHLDLDAQKITIDFS